MEVNTVELDLGVATRKSPVARHLQPNHPIPPNQSQKMLVKPANSLQESLLLRKPLHLD
jgi:hypothetical protein